MQNVEFKNSNCSFCKFITCKVKYRGEEPPQPNHELEMEQADAAAGSRRHRPRPKKGAKGPRSPGRLAIDQLGFFVGEFFPDNVGRAAQKV